MAINTTTLEVTFAGELTDEQIEALTFEFDPALEVEKVERKADVEVAVANAEKTTTVVLTTKEQDPEANYKLVAVNDTELEAPIEVEISEIRSVRAINTTVDKNGTLEFAINGKEKAADLKALNEAGYTVTFNASANVFEGSKPTSTTGVVNAEPGTKFEYQVVISKDGETVAESARQAVEVQDYANTVTAITNVNVDLDGQSINDGQLALGDSARLIVKGTVKGNDDEVTLPATFTVDRPAVLSVDKDGVVTPKAKGTATVTVKSGELTKTITLNVGDARVVDATKSTIDKTSVSIAADKSETIIVELKDQYGLPIAGTVVADNSDADAKVITGEVTVDEPVNDKDGKPIVGKYELTLTAVGKDATGDVVVKVGSTEIGKINVSVKEAGEVAEYKLTADKTEFDLKIDDAGSATSETTLKAYDKNGLETTVEGTFEYESSNKDVVTVDKDSGKVTLSANAKAGDKATIIVKKVAGAFKDPVAQVEFTVVDSTPEITDVTFTSTPAITEATELDLSKILDVKASGSKGDVKVGYTVADDNTLNIYEANSNGTLTQNDEGEITNVKIGEVKLTNSPAGLGVKFTQDGEATAGKATVEVSLVDQTVGGDSPQPAQNKGSFNIAVIDKGNNFKGDTTIDVNLTTITADKEALDKIKAYGFDGNIENLEEKYPKTEDDLKGVKQSPTTLADVAKFLKVQYDATLNTQNIVAKDGKITIDGPLLSAADFKKIKGDKPGAYRLTIDGVAKIAISPDGTATFEALPQKN